MGLDPVVATVGGVLLGVLLCTVGFIACRIWKRNRYYKKVQHSLDEEERAFQECALALQCARREGLLPLFSPSAVAVPPTAAAARTQHN